MSISQHFCDASQWAQTHFGDVPLGDVRRTRRVCTLAAGWARQPGASIPRLGAGSAYASKAAYQLLGSVAATPDTLQGPHRALVLQQLQQAGTYLLLEDTTQLRWAPATARRAGLGPVGASVNGEQGVLLHSLVAARWPSGNGGPSAATRPPLPLLGLLDQQFYVRQARSAAEKAHPHGGTRPRQGRARESDLWAQSLRAIGSPPPQGRWVVVADRGADIYAHLYQCQQQGLGFVVRAAQDRGLATAAAGSAATLFAVARAQPSAGQMELSLRARPGQAARLAHLQVSYCPGLAIRSPQRPGASAGKGPPVAASVVRVWEPGGKLEWLLLCDDVVLNGNQARERAQQYASRWLMEEFHKALKTGLGAERLQLHTAPRLFAAVALLSVVALALVDLREHSRQRPDAPAETAGLSASYLGVLRSQCNRPLQTVREVYHALAGLGGHLGRTGDGPPGWQTLWLGMVHLRYLVEGVKLAARLPREQP